MKKCIVLLFVTLFLVCTSVASAEIITWTNPVEYADGSAISTADKGAIITAIKIKGVNEAEYVSVATVKYGGKSWSGTLPSAYVPGSEVQISLTSILYNLPSAETVVNYTIPVIPPKSPVDVVVGR